VEAANPLGPDAAGLLQEMTAEIRARYADLLDAAGPQPVNDSLVFRSTYLIARIAGEPVGCAALRPIDEQTAEVRRMYVIPAARRRGIARRLLSELEQQAGEFGYSILRLETGNRQHEAIALYESRGFHRIAPYGWHARDPLSICFEKAVRAPRDKNAPRSSGVAKEISDSR
jgi:GNAT superfamily N-acetyltransferase